MKRLTIRCLSLLFPLAIGAQQPYASALTIGTVDSLWSRTLNENRKFLVYTPPSYHDTTYLPRAYPVVYLLDGDAHFHSFTGIIQALGTGVNGTFVVPEMIVVAIPNTDRMRDLSPTHVDAGLDGKLNPAMKSSGGMPNFLQFIKSELIPKIESSYRTAPYRMLVGHSLGGIAAIDALYTMPETFNSYIAIDPSLWWDHRVLLKEAKERLAKPGLTGRALYVAQANTLQADDSLVNEHFGSIVQFNALVGAHPESGLRYAYKYYPSDSHGSVPLAAEYDGLRFIFEGYDLNLQRSVAHPTYVTEHYRDVSKLLGFLVPPPESTIDLLGHLALASDTTNAITFFEMNAALYPRSAKAWDALGEGWQAKGEAKKAIGFYEKSLALRPGNKHAKDMIAKLSGAK